MLFYNIPRKCYLPFMQWKTIMEMLDYFLIYLSSHICQNYHLIFQDSKFSICHPWRFSDVEIAVKYFFIKIISIAATFFFYINFISYSEPQIMLSIFIRFFCFCHLTTCNLILKNHHLHLGSCLKSKGIKLYLACFRIIFLILICQMSFK